MVIIITSSCSKLNIMSVNQVHSISTRNSITQIPPLITYIIPFGCLSWKGCARVLRKTWVYTSYLRFPHKLTLSVWLPLSLFELFLSARHTTTAVLMRYKRSYAPASKFLKLSSGCHYEATKWEPLHLIVRVIHSSPRVIYYFGLFSRINSTTIVKVLF